MCQFNSLLSTDLELHVPGTVGHLEVSKNVNIYCYEWTTQQHTSEKYLMQLNTLYVVAVTLSSKPNER